MIRIGIDLGGTKTEIIALDPHGCERWRRRVPTPAGDYSATVETIVVLVEEAERTLGTRVSVGVGIPGSVSPLTGRIRNANSTCLIGQPLREDLEARLGREVRLANDANCLAVSESTDGAGAGADVVFAAILGTGVGGGLVVHGRLLVGANAIAGEWGHSPLPSPGDEDRPLPGCYCGRSGCIETYLSGPGMALDHGRRTGARLDAAAIAAGAEDGDPGCVRTLQLYERRLARSLAGVINLVDPDVIVLGGGLSKLERLYLNVPWLWGEWIISDQVLTRLLPARHGDSSGVRGAAWLWPLGAEEGQGDASETD
ncbi:ROK family protein [Imhoffiella purpurea]|uniref:ROK family Glucokinase with ambiguous substrate specificity n=1 Tax=Imhoffiella purpurea TaxID=1249627 RepID=W9UXJ5_9GAMM|nr:ROK family protein [Imhoffiella purpurea]EXJ11968.1 ROK family Glucokinase with ambiguous substrate specificity [Imhoffiella purpurea]